MDWNFGNPALALKEYCDQSALFVEKRRRNDLLASELPQKQMELEQKTKEVGSAQARLQGMGEFTDGDTDAQIKAAIQQADTQIAGIQQTFEQKKKELTAKMEADLKENDSRLTSELQRLLGDGSDVNRALTGAEEKALSFEMERRKYIDVSNEVINTCEDGITQETLDCQSAVGQLKKKQDEITAVQLDGFHVCYPRQVEWRAVHHSRSCQAWCEGEGSFSTAARTSQAGDAALETAQHLEASVQDLFTNFWSSHPMGEAIQMDTSRPTVRSEDFDTLKELYNKYFNDIGTTGEEAVSSIRESGSENPTYNIILPAVMAIAEPIKYAFEQFSAKIDEAKEQSEALTQQQTAHNEEAAETATQTNSSAAEIADAVNMFPDI